MNKFLKLVENNLPSEKETVTHKLVTKLVELLDSLDGVDVSTIYPDQIRIDINGNSLKLKLQGIKSGGPEEDAENKATVKDMELVDQGVEGMADRQGANSPPGQGVIRRDVAAKQGLGVYNKITDDLTKAIRNVSTSRY